MAVPGLRLPPYIVMIDDSNFECVTCGAIFSDVGLHKLNSHLKSKEHLINVHSYEYRKKEADQMNQQQSERIASAIFKCFTDGWKEQEIRQKQAEEQHIQLLDQEFQETNSELEHNQHLQQAKQQQLKLLKEEEALLQQKMKRLQMIKRSLTNKTFDEKQR